MALARANGCAHVIDYRREHFAARAEEITGGRGVDVIYAGISRDVFVGNLEACVTRGFFISCGHASSPPGPIDAMRINAKSMYFNKSSMFSYVTWREIGDRMANHVLEMMVNGALKPEISRVFAPADVAHALADIDARRTTASVVAVP